MSCFITSKFNFNTEKSVNIAVYKRVYYTSTSFFRYLVNNLYVSYELCIMSTASAQSGEKTADHATKMTKKENLK